MKRVKKIMVTGGAGFVGSHLCEKLLGQGHKIFCLDDFSTGFERNVEHLKDNENFELIVHDVIEPINRIDVDEIYNLACPASPEKYQKDPVKTMKVNILGAINVLELARSTKAKVFQASTSEVYGDPIVHPQNENYLGNVNPLGIRACYDEGKRSAETLFSDYQRRYGVDIRIARLFNTYGPRMSSSDGRVVSNFVNQALSKKNITVYGDGTQTRSFCYIDDMIEAFALLMANEEIGCQVVNLGNPDEFTISELASLVINKTNSKVGLVYHELPQDDPMKRKPDINRAKEILGWEPKTPLEVGLDKTILYYESYLNE